MSKQHHVFLSYSRSDTAMMRRVSDDLRRAGLRVWNDEQLEPGTESWKNAIQEAIENSATVVVLLSPDAKKSEWIERELDYARAQRVPIIPVIIQGDSQSAVPFLLISVQRADMRKDYQAGLAALMGALCASLKMPELCPDESAAIASDQALPAASSDQAAPRPGDPVIFAGQLRAWNPLDYIKLLGLYLFDPDRYHTYEPNANRRLAVWLATTLFWLPFGINALAYRLSEVRVWSLSEQIHALLPTWLIVAAWVLTGVIGQVHFDVRTGLRAFLRGPLQFAAAAIGLGAALVYTSTIFYVSPPLESRDGLIYLLASQPQYLLIIAGGLSVFVGAILANNTARGFASWLGLWMSIGFLALYAIMLYIPVEEGLVSTLQLDTSGSNLSEIAIFSYGSVICCGSVLLSIIGITIGGAFRKRQVGRFNFVLPVMLVGAYSLFAWVHLLGGA